MSYSAQDLVLIIGGVAAGLATVVGAVVSAISTVSGNRERRAEAAQSKVDSARREAALASTHAEVLKVGVKADGVLSAAMAAATAAQTATTAATGRADRAEGHEEGRVAAVAEAKADKP